MAAKKKAPSKKALFHMVDGKKVKGRSPLMGGQPGKGLYGDCTNLRGNCKEAKGQWLHLSAPFPPRGGLPKNVKWLRVVVYAYWPPGDFVFDDVMLYKAPRQKAPQPEEKARTKRFKSGIQPQPK